MKTLELASMIERYNAGVMSPEICEDYLKAAAELRRLAAVEAELERIKAMPPVGFVQYLNDEWLSILPIGTPLYALEKKHENHQSL